MKIWIRETKEGYTETVMNADNHDEFVELAELYKGFHDDDAAYLDHNFQCLTICAHRKLTDQF